MKKYPTSYFFFLLMVTNTHKIQAQTNLTGWQVGAGIGNAVYEGDLTPSKLGSYKKLDPAISINVARYFSASVKLRSFLGSFILMLHLLPSEII